MLSLNEKHIEEKSGLKNLPVIKNKWDPLYKKRRYELVDKPKKQPDRKFLRTNAKLKVMMDHRTVKSCNLKRNLEFRLHDKEQKVLKSIKEAFEGEDMQTQYNVLG